MAKPDLVALMFDDPTARFKIVRVNSEASRKRIGVELRRSDKEFRYCENVNYSPVGEHRYFELGKKVKGLIGVYDSKNNGHLQRMVEDSKYASLIRFERMNDHD